MSTINLAALRTLEAAATPRPWEVMGSGSVLADGRIREVVADTYPSGNGPKHNAAFIAAARNALPDLLDRLEAAEAKVARVEEVLAEWDQDEHYCGEGACVRCGAEEIRRRAALDVPSGEGADS